MRIAFDVKGTIEGSSKDKVLRLFKALEAMGHELLVWSNSYQYAVDAVKNNDLKCPYTTKTMKMDTGYDESQYVDIAIEDDTSQTWLASKRFIWVHDLPDDIEEFAKRITQKD